MKQEDWELLAKRLSGELSAAEELDFNSWLKSDSNNETIFKEAGKFWNVSAELSIEYIPDSEKAWEKLKAKIEFPNSGAKVISSQRRSWLKIAAAIVVIAAVGFALKFIFSDNRDKTNNELQFVEVSAADSVNIFFLPDNSKIYLNKKSSITYADAFADTARITYLIGEAYFEVTKNSKPFIVYAGGTQIRVTGTAFDVKANDDYEKVEVIVVEGKVVFSEQGSSPSSNVTLEANDKITFDRSKKEYKREKNSNKNFWWDAINLEHEVKKSMNKIKKGLRKK